MSISSILMPLQRSIAVSMALAVAAMQKLGLNFDSMSPTSSSIAETHFQIIPVNWCDDFEFETRFRRLNQFHHLLLRKPFDIDARHFDDEIAFFKTPQLCTEKKMDGERGRERMKASDFVNRNFRKSTFCGTLTSANEFGLTNEIITGESPLNLNPKSSANSLFR